jgi:lipid II:glycine glycyltransferase (peptidoglycan interpeptide bridge formation enzyme)
MDSDYAGGEAAVYLYEDGERRFLLPVVVRPIPGTDLTDLSSPYGYPGPTSNADSADETFWRAAADGLVEVLASSSIVSCFVRMHPLLPINLDALSAVGAVVQHGYTVSIDLTKSEQEMWSQVRPNHRRQINRADRAGATVLIDEWDRLSTFVDVYHETMRRVGASDYYFFERSYFDRLRSALGDRVHLVTIEFGETVAGGGIFFECGGIVQYHLGATRTDYLSQQPTKLMFDKVRRWAKSRGNLAFHLGGGVGSEGDPLFHFKSGFSHDWRPFYTWRIVADQVAYRSLTVAHCRSEDGTDLRQYFPAYRRQGA